MFGLPPSIVLYVLAGITLHRNGVEAITPAEMLRNALEELTRAVSVPLSAIIGLLPREHDPDFDDESEPSEFQEGQAYAGETAESTVSAMLVAAVEQAHEVIEAISGAASLADESVEGNGETEQEKGLEPEAEPADKAEGSESTRGEAVDKGEPSKYRHEAEGSIEGSTSQIQEAVTEASEELQSKNEPSEFEQVTRQHVKDAATQIEAVVSDAKEAVDATKESEELRADVEDAVVSATAKVAVLLLEARQKIEAAKQSEEPKKAAEHAIKDVSGKIRKVFSEARDKLAAAEGDSAKHRLETVEALKAAETKVVELLFESQKLVAKEESAEHALESLESVREADAEVEKLILVRDEGQASNLVTGRFEEVEKSMEVAEDDIETFLEVREEPVKLSE